MPPHALHTLPVANRGAASSAGEWSEATMGGPPVPSAGPGASARHSPARSAGQQMSGAHLHDGLIAPLPAVAVAASSPSAVYSREYGHVSAVMRGTSTAPWPPTFATADSCRRGSGGWRDDRRGLGRRHVRDAHGGQPRAGGGQRYRFDGGDLPARRPRRRPLGQRGPIAQEGDNDRPVRAFRAGQGRLGRQLRMWDVRHAADAEDSEVVHHRAHLRQGHVREIWRLRVDGEGLERPHAAGDDQAGAARRPPDPTAPLIKPTSTAGGSATKAAMSDRSVTREMVAGAELRGMPRTVVMPSAAAANMPDPTPSLHVPGTLRCT